MSKGYYSRFLCVTLLFFFASCNGLISAHEEIKQERDSQENPCNEQIKFLSETDPAYKYLEIQQEKIYKGFPDLTDPFLRGALSNSSRKRNLNDLIEDLREQGLTSPEVEAALKDYLYCEALPTKYESPLFRFGLDILVRPLSAASTSLIETPKFGSLPTGQVNGQALLPPGSKTPIIIIERDVFSFTGAFSKAISDAVPIDESAEFVSLSYDKSNILLRLEREPEIVENFADAMIRMIRDGSPRGANERFLERNHNLLHARLVSGMDQFIIAHEIAHVELKHTNDTLRNFGFTGKREWIEKAESDEQALTFVERSKRHELDADERGFQLLVKANGLQGDNDDDIVGLLVQAAAAETLFLIYEAIEIYRRQAKIIGFDSRSHPTASERKAIIRGVLEKHRNEIKLLTINADFREIFAASFSVLLEKADPLIRTELKLPPDSDFDAEMRILPSTEGPQ